MHQFHEVLLGLSGLQCYTVNRTVISPTKSVLTKAEPCIFPFSYKVYELKVKKATFDKVEGSKA